MVHTLPDRVGLKAHLDESIPAEMGLVGQETTGRRFLDGTPRHSVMVEIAQDIEHYNPGAWLISTPTRRAVAEAIKKTCNIRGSP